MGGVGGYMLSLEPWWERPTPSGQWMGQRDWQRNSVCGCLCHIHQRRRGELSLVTVKTRTRVCTKSLSLLVVTEVQSALCKHLSAIASLLTPPTHTYTTRLLHFSVPFDLLRKKEQLWLSAKKHQRLQFFHNLPQGEDQFSCMSVHGWISATVKTQCLVVQTTFHLQLLNGPN